MSGMYPGQIQNMKVDLALWLRCSDPEPEFLQLKWIDITFIDCGRQCMQHLMVNPPTGIPKNAFWAEIAWASTKAPPWAPMSECQYRRCQRTLLDGLWYRG